MSYRPAVVVCVLALLTVPFIAGRELAAQTPDSLERARQKMVSQFIAKEGVKNPRVLDAMRQVPRHLFMPARVRAQAYTDSAWSIGYRQTISPPFIVAYMTESLDPQPTDRVLEIGTGSGYQAAVLSLLVKEVFTIEIVEPLGHKAARRLSQLGYHNVKTKVGDGYLGWPEHKPFDKIIVTCSPENIPQPLVDQLKEGGRMIIPLGERYHQDMYLVEKKGGKLVRRLLQPTLFVPMTGRSEKERSTKPDPLHPRIQNGGFEERESDGEAAAWHYQREMTLIDKQAPDGGAFARFQNEEPGHVSQALQGMAIDGRQIGSLRFHLRVRTDHIQKGPESYQQADIEINFFDNDRRRLDDVVVARWTGTSDWHAVSATIEVPEKAREAIVRIGLHGATGVLDVDNITMTSQRRKTL